MPPRYAPPQHSWSDLHSQRPARYTCGWCGGITATNYGYGDENSYGHIYICSACQRPTYLSPTKQVPGVPFGQAIEHLPGKVQAIYDEARVCMTNNAYTGAVMLCRVLLLHIAVEKGATCSNFLDAVNYLDAHHFNPPGSQDWINRIRKQGNATNHDLVITTRDEAEELVTYIEMLLRFIYEFPGKYAAATGGNP